MPDEQDAPTEPASPGKPRLRHWFSRFTEPVVIVASIAALASATFAYQTNSISQRQVELLHRQVAIEEALALPVFTVSMGVDASTHRITIENSGGRANDLAIDVMPFLSYWWTEDDGTGEPVMMQGDELPLVGYFDEYGHALPSRMAPGATTTLGFDHNAAALADVSGRLGAGLTARDDVTGLDHALEVMVTLDYIDYMGVERSDYYIGQVSSTGDVFPPHQFLRVDTATGEEMRADYYGKFDRQFMLVLDPETAPPDDAMLRDLGARIYAQRFTDGAASATPVTVRPAPVRESGTGVFIRSSARRWRTPRIPPLP